MFFLFTGEAMKVVQFENPYLKLSAVGHHRVPDAHRKLRLLTCLPHPLPGSHLSLKDSQFPARGERGL